MGACQGAMAIDGHLVVGVLPDDGSDPLRRQATASLDLALFTGLGQARNVINVVRNAACVIDPQGRSAPR